MTYEEFLAIHLACVDECGDEYEQFLTEGEEKWK